VKKVYISLLLHLNMCYDRYTKQEIREKFPRVYATVIRAMHRFPQITAHVVLPGLTTLSLKHHAKWLLDELQPLVERRQAVMVGSQYAASHAVCSDEESDVVAGRVGMGITRDKLQPDVCTFVPQEELFHPQLPYIMKEIGATRLIFMPEGLKRPWRVKGIDGSEVILYPLVSRFGGRSGTLEEFYDTHEDGDFVMIGGDFECRGNAETLAGNLVQEIKELAGKGKLVEWMTVDRYEEEIGVKEQCAAPNPCGYTSQDRESSPSFSRWVSDPEDIIWHGYAVEALDAIRSAGFAKVAAKMRNLGDADVPMEGAWTTEPDNVWDHRFEHVLEYPETEERCLTLDGKPTLLSRAWHHLIIGLNSDASGWVPWMPRTRHRSIAMQASRALSNEVLVRFARLLAAKIERPKGEANAYVLALNATPARTAEVSLPIESPMALMESSGEAIPTAVWLRDGKWSARARVELPAYGYKVFGLAASAEVETYHWTDGDEVHFAGRAARLSEGKLTISEGAKQVEVSVAPFRLSDPSGVAETEDVVPNWDEAEMRVRQTMYGADLEVFAELAWAVWLRLVISLREDRAEITAEVYVDMPRQIGKERYDPEGILLQFRGQSGSVFYDVPYATIQHKNDDASFVAVQRFVALEGEACSFGLIALGGNQSFKVVGQEGIIAAGLGASKQGRPARRPEYNIRPDGSGEQKAILSADPFMGSYEHRFALLFADRTQMALVARRLRTAVPLIWIEPGEGRWPAEQSLLEIGPETAHITAFRVTKEGCEVVVNNLSGKANRVSCKGVSIDLMGYGVATLRL